LKIRWLLFSGIIGLFLLVDVFKGSCLSKGGERAFSEVNAFFKGAICDVLLFWKKGGGRKRDGT
jgi:hypothetical protein